MLNTLSIEQFAIIDHSNIHFKQGFNILTGETGAGKSILIDAIGHILGERADISLIRHGAEKADIQAQFSDIPHDLRTILIDNEHQDPDNPSDLHLRRIIREKGSKIFINSQTTTGVKLRQYAEQLVNIHGQHANQALLQNSEQRRRLDRYGKLEALLEETATNYYHWQALCKQRDDWQVQRQSQQERLALLSYQLEELNTVAPKDNEFTELEAEHSILASADEILMKGQTLSHLIHEDTPSILSLLHRAEQLVEQLVMLSPQYQESAELIGQSTIYLQEAYDSLSHHLHRTEHDPAALSVLDERLHTLHNLARKHKIDTAELHHYWQQLIQEYQQLENTQEQSERLDEAIKQAKESYLINANKLTEARQKAATSLAQDALQWIRQLGMEKAQFIVKLTPTEKFAAHGRDDITFLLCANPGQSLQPLSKVASGGELSRISLAIEVACLDDNAVPHTLIFDEIDAGIGGEVADTVGRLLAKLSQTRQVLCISHLPQVAAYAHHHFRIEKISDDISTQTRVLPLNHEQRIIEIARMLGNAESNTSREHAKAMLNQAHQKQ